tara:strand:- start:114 stop:266 length:153 start_codon:yes stop_codon:yes gene_type:complete
MSKTAAEYQREHYLKKTETHFRLCVWVPKEHTEEIKATIARKLKRLEAGK